MALSQGVVIKGGTEKGKGRMCVKTLSANAESAYRKLSTHWDISLVWFGFMSVELHVPPDPAWSVYL